MIFDMSVGHNEARLGGTLAYLDSGAGNAHVELYEGTKPSTPGAAPTGSVLLVDVVLPKPCAEIVTGGLSFFVSGLATITNSGEAMWARWYNGGDEWAGDSDVTAEGGGGFVQLPDTTLYAGGKAQILGGVVG